MLLNNNKACQEDVLVKFNQHLTNLNFMLQKDCQVDRNSSDMKGRSDCMVLLGNFVAGTVPI